MPRGAGMDEECVTHAKVAASWLADQYTRINPHEYDQFQTRILASSRSKSVFNRNHVHRVLGSTSKQDRITRGLRHTIRGKRKESLRLATKRCLCRSRVRGLGRRQMSHTCCCCCGSRGTVRPYRPSPWAPLLRTSPNICPQVALPVPSRGRGTESKGCVVKRHQPGTTFRVTKSGGEVSSCTNDSEWGVPYSSKRSMQQDYRLRRHAKAKRAVSRLHRCVAPPFTAKESAPSLSVSNL